MPSVTWWNLEQRKRQLIIDASLTEFATYDIQRASLSNIVKCLGIAKGSMYQYFSDKEELYLYILKYANEQLINQLRNRIPIAVYAQSDMFTILRHYVLVMLDLQKLSPREYSFTQRAIRDSGSQVVVARTIGLSMQSAFVDDLIQTAVTNRSIRDDVPYEVMRFLVNTVISATSEYLFLHPDEDPTHVTDFFDQLIVLLDQGMRFQIRK